MPGCCHFKCVLRDVVLFNQALSVLTAAHLRFVQLAHSVETSAQLLVSFDHSPNFSACVLFRLCMPDAHHIQPGSDFTVAVPVSTWYVRASIDSSVERQFFRLLRFSRKLPAVHGKFGQSHARLERVPSLSKQLAAQRQSDQMPVLGELFAQLLFDVCSHRLALRRTLLDCVSHVQLESTNFSTTPVLA